MMNNVEDRWINLKALQMQSEPTPQDGQGDGGDSPDNDDGEPD